MKDASVMTEQTKTMLNKGNTYVSIGMLIVMCGMVYKIATMDATLKLHIRDPELHSNINSKLRETYVTKDEMKALYSGLDTEVKHIRRDIKEMKELFVQFIKKNEKK